MDKRFKDPADFHISDPVAEKAATEDVEKFLAEMNETDKKLRVNNQDL